MSSKLSKPQWTNRKATSLIYNALVSRDKIHIHEGEDKYWVTNGYLAFAYKKEDFIFNPNLFAPIDLHAILENATMKSTAIAKLEGYRIGKHSRDKINAKLTAEGMKPTYVSKNYLDCFSNDCTLLKSSSPLDPVLVLSFYGEECGLILPIRVNEDE